MFAFGGFLIEVSTFSALGLDLPTYFAFDLLMVLVFAMILFIIPSNIVSTVCGFIILLLQTAVSFTNINLFKYHGQIFTRDLFRNADFLKDNNVNSFIDWGAITQFAAILALYAIICCLAIFSIKNAKIQLKAHSAVVLAVICFVTSITLPQIYHSQIRNFYVDTQSNSLMRTDDKSLYSNMSTKLSFFSKFGTYPMYINNILFARNFGITKKIGDKEYKDYFDKLELMPKSDFFGVDKDNNLIIVMMESCDEFLIHPKYTPTLYNIMMGEDIYGGINFTNYHVKNLTDISEASVILGSYPSDTTLVGTFSKPNFDPTLSNFYDFALPFRLKANGFDTANYFHPANGNGYSRNLTHTQDFGFDNAYFASYFDNGDNFDYYAKWQYPEQWFIEKHIEEFMPTDKRFFSFLTTINAHAQYWEVSPHAQIYKDMIDDDDFIFINEVAYQFYKNALSRVMEVDKGVEYIFAELKSRNILDKTTVLLYTDHNAYGNDLVKTVKKTIWYMPLEYRVPAFIYSPGIKKSVYNINPNVQVAVEHITIDKFTTTYDLVPTLFQLLGMNLNLQYYLGNDPFGDDETIIISPTAGIFNDKFFTADGILVYYKVPDATDDDFRIFQENVAKYQEKYIYINELYKKGSPPIDW